MTPRYRDGETVARQQDRDAETAGIRRANDTPGTGGGAALDATATDDNVGQSDRDAVSVAIPEGFDSVEDVFDYGYCHALALALHEQTGWPVVGLRCPEGYAEHYLVRRPDGLLVDAHGARTDAAVLTQWSGDSGYYSIKDYSTQGIWYEVNRGDLENPTDVWWLAQSVASGLIKPAHDSDFTEAAPDDTVDMATVEPAPDTSAAETVQPMEIQGRPNPAGDDRAPAGPADPGARRPCSRPTPSRTRWAARSPVEGSPMALWPGTPLTSSVIHRRSTSRAGIRGVRPPHSLLLQRRPR